MPRLPAIVFLLATTLPAHAVTPSVGVIQPSGGTRGTTTTITFIGDRLDNPLEVIAHEPGVSIKELVAESPQRVKATVVIAPDCPLGEHAFRLRTASGLSDLRTFWIGALPIVAEIEPNGEFDTAQIIALNSTITGVIKREDVDYFQVECKKGQRLAVEVEGMRLARQFWDPAVAILDSRRFEVAVSDDAPGLGQDCGCSVVIPADGKYTIQLRESAYQGGDDCEYRLHVGEFPRPSAVVPCGGKPGETIEVRFLGDARGEIKQNVTFPKSVGEFRFHLQAQEGIHPAGVRFRVSDLPAITDSPAAATMEGAVVGVVPGAFQGTLAGPGPNRYFRFAAKKGQVFDAKCYARRLGSPLDAVMSVKKFDGGKPGAQIAINDDDSGSPDPAFRLQIPDDGDYLISVGDHLSQFGPDYFFRIELTPPAPATVATLPKVDGNNVTNQDRQMVPVPRGGRTAVLVTATRSDWGGAAAINFSPLPAGITTTLDALDASMSQLPVVLAASETAPLVASAAEIAVKPADANVHAPSRTEMDFQFCIGLNNTPFVSYQTDRVAVAVVETMPYSIEVVEPKLPVPQNGAMNVKVIAKRAKDFKAAIALYPVWTPPGMGIQGGVTIPAEATEVTVSINAAGNAPLKAWKTALFGFADTGKGTATVSTQLFKLEVGSPVVNLTQNRVAVDQGQSVKIACAVVFPQPLTGKATVKLLGLPAKATAADLPLNSDAKEIVFDVQTDKETPAGKHNVFCQIITEKDGETASQSSGGGELRVDVPLPPKKTETAVKPAMPKPADKPKPAEKPLTRLEKLRKEQEAREKK